MHHKVKNVFHTTKMTYTRKRDILEYSLHHTRNETVRGGTTSTNETKWLWMVRNWAKDTGLDLTMASLARKLAKIKRMWPRHLFSQSFHPHWLRESHWESFSSKQTKIGFHF